MFIFSVSCVPIEIFSVTCVESYKDCLLKNVADVKSFVVVVVVWDIRCHRRVPRRRRSGRDLSKKISLLVDDQFRRPLRIAS